MASAAQTMLARVDAVAANRPRSPPHPPQDTDGAAVMPSASKDAAVVRSESVSESASGTAGGTASQDCCVDEQMRELREERDLVIAMAHGLKQEKAEVVALLESLQTERQDIVREREALRKQRTAMLEAAADLRAARDAAAGAVIDLQREHSLADRAARSLQEHLSLLNAAGAAAVAAVTTSSCSSTAAPSNTVELVPERGAGSTTTVAAAAMAAASAAATACEAADTSLRRPSPPRPKSTLSWTSTVAAAGAGPITAAGVSPRPNRPGSNSRSSAQTPKKNGGKASPRSSASPRDSPDRVRPRCTDGAGNERSGNGSAGVPAAIQRAKAQQPSGNDANTWRRQGNSAGGGGSHRSRTFRQNSPVAAVVR